MSSKLTIKQEKFVQGLLKGLSQREAYKKSYDCTRMKDSVIDVKACELLKSGKVSVRYDELRGKVVKKAEEEGLLSATDILRKINELILRNERDDDKTALNGLVAYGKYHGMWVEKTEHSGEINIPTINIVSK